jgi:hypothetical protein
MGLFFIDTDTGQVATQNQLIEAGIADRGGSAPRPWHRIQGTGDASTLWYAVVRRKERGIFMGALVLRHSPHHDLLLQRGWEEIPVDEIAAERGAHSVPAAGPEL